MLIATNILSYIMGVVLSWIILRPMDAWEQGWQKAKEIYSDYHRGFENGFNAAWDEAKKEFTDRDSWFEAGWNGAFEAIDNSDYIMIKPTEYMALKLEEMLKRENK